jgi:hypothetical protein
MKSNLITRIFALILFTLSINLLGTAQAQNLNDFIVQIQDSLNQKDMNEYLENYSDDIRGREESDIRDKLDSFTMERVALFKMGEMGQGEDRAEVYLQAIFQNSYSVIIETWHLNLLVINDRWMIQKKNVIGNFRSLYTIHIPSNRVEKVESIEVEHEDIQLSFKDALLFYDNIPELETALLVIGKGDFRFYPSDPEERHQLELSYKKELLQDDLTYAYFRFSNHFFQNNVKIAKIPGEKDFIPSQEEKKEAESLFSKHYPRSFTVENSLNKQLLSTLPQSNEAVFSFRGKKLGTFTYVYSPFADEEINLYRWKDKNIINLYSPTSKVTQRELFLTFGQMFEVKSYAIEVDYKPQESFLSGRAKIEVESNVGSLDKLKFKLNPQLRILRIQDEEGRALFFNQDKLRETLYIYFVHPPPKNKPYSVEIYYRGKLRPPAQLADVVAAPQIYRQDDTGKKISIIDVKFETFLFSQRANWYPSPSENDYFKASIKISIPASYQCISNGELIQKTLLNADGEVKAGDEAESAAYNFEMRHPVKYLSFIVGKFTKIEEDLNSLPLQHFYSSGVLLEKKGLLKKAEDILRFFEEKFGAYPYGKLDIARRLWTTTGGHSPASFIILNELYQTPDSSLLVPIRSPVDLSRWKEYFIAHEIAHQWWGQAVTWKTYHDHWISEGLAQFAAVLYLRERYGKDVLEPIFGKLSQWTEKKSKWGPITLGPRISMHDPLAFQTVVYNKTALALNMLKDLLGEEIFFTGLKRFYLRHKFAAASTRDFIEVMEETAGTDLKKFFRDWFDSYALPKVSVSHSVQKSSDGYILKLKINQIKEVFIFPLWIEWIENGDRFRRMVIVDEKNEEFELDLRVKPQKIEINPDNAVPGKFH